MTWEEAVMQLKSQPGSGKLVRSCYFDDPLIEAAHRFSVSEEWKAVINLLRPWIPGKVLDLGAGNGISSYAFSKAGCQVTALEPDPSLIVGAGAIRRLAREAQLSIKVDQAFGECLPYSDRCFDVIYGRQVLHHAQSLKRLCAEAARVLRPGGVFLATREHVIATPNDMETFLSSHPLHHLYGGENAHLIAEYTAAVKEAGFETCKVIGPFESVINYFPASSQDVRHAAVRDFVEFNFPKFFAPLFRLALHSLCGICQALNSYILKLHNRRGYYPGICYSFFACKAS